MMRSVLTSRVLTIGLGLALTLATPTLAVDSDSDGLKDGFESKYGLTSPLDPDTDGDGVIDSAEDHDGDNLGDRGEQRFGTDPRKRDTDRDGRSDGREDTDRDGRSNAKEQDQRPLPGSLRPPLDKVHKDYSPDRKVCQTWADDPKVTTCEFGPASATEIVLLGDSHATMYLSAMKPTLQARGWHLTTMVKSGCPPLLGVHSSNQFARDGGKSCRKWRRSVLDLLHTDPPEHIIIAHSDAYALRYLDGRVVPKWKRPQVWKQGLQKTLAAFPKSSRVLVLGDGPDNHGNPIRCLRKNRGDISACVSPKEPRAQRTIENALRKAASLKGADFRSLYGKICTYDPCPLVQGKVLIWRDEDHLSETFIRQLQPSVDAILVEQLAPSAAKRRK